MILLDVSAESAFHRDVFAVLLVALQFMPVLVGFISSLVEWHEADKSAEESPAEVDSPNSPLAANVDSLGHLSRVGTNVETKPDEEQPKTFRDDEELPNT